MPHGMRDEVKPLIPEKIYPPLLDDKLLHLAIQFDKI